MSAGVETSEAPAWLSALERQRERLSRARLGHDSGAGAPCNQCGPKCPGLELHFWRRVCRACHCAQALHDVPDDDLTGWAQFQLLGATRNDNTTLSLIKIKGVSDEPVAVDWLPPDVAPDLAAEYMESLGELAPVAGSEGARRRRVARRLQLPPHDVAPERAAHASAAALRDHAAYVARLRAGAAGVGRVVRAPPPHAMRAASQPALAPSMPTYATQSEGAVAEPGACGGCGGCGEALRGGQAAVRAARLAAPLWHGACFRCAACGELLADLVYVAVGGRPHCARDAAAALGVPRCAGCDELVFERPYTVAEGRAFHVHHFCCYRCDAPLGGARYVADAEAALPACLACYEAHVAARCAACGAAIGAAQQGVAWGALHWHAACFACAGAACGRSLLAGKFVVKQDLPFCSVPCVRSRIPQPQP